MRYVHPVLTGERLPEDEIEKNARATMATGMDLHVHAWRSVDFTELLEAIAPSSNFTMRATYRSSTKTSLSCGEHEKPVPRGPRLKRPLKIQTAARALMRTAANAPAPRAAFWRAASLWSTFLIRSAAKSCCASAMPRSKDSS